MIKNTAKIYADLIIKGKKTMADVPLELRDEVQKYIDEMSKGEEQ